MTTPRRLAIALSAGLISALLSASPAGAADVLGTVTSVDADAKTVTISPKAGGSDLTVSVSDNTEFIGAKGKVVKNMELRKLKRGTEVEIAHENAEASKVVVKKAVTKANGTPVRAKAKAKKKKKADAK